MISHLFLGQAARDDFTVAIFISLVLFTGTLRGENIEETALRFEGASGSGKVELRGTYTSEQKAGIIRHARELLENPSYGREPLMDTLAFLGEEDAIRDIVRRFAERKGIPSAYLAAVHDPRIIELIAPYFLRNDPERLTGGDAIVLPLSFEATEAAALLLSDSPVFTDEVHLWARSLHGLTGTEQRPLIQTWWRVNEGFFRVKRYELVRPGPPPPRDPMAHLQVIPENSDAAPDTHTSDAFSSLVQGEPEPPVKQVPATLQIAVKPEETSSRTASSGALLVSAAAMLALAGGLLIFWNRRAL